MKRRAYRDMILRAAKAPDGQLLDLLATRLADDERAGEILLAKGYRSAAPTLSALAKAVPERQSHERTTWPT